MQTRTMIMKLATLLLSFILMSCTNTAPEPKRNEKIIIANRVSKECAEKLSKRYGMVQTGQGGAMMYEIEDLFLAFDIHRSLSKEEARAILIDCAQEVISTVNQNTEIQKYLLPEGFNKKSVQIQIFIDENYQENYHPDLSVCSYNFGSLAYKTNDIDNKYRYKTSERETYEEAVALLEASKVLSK